LLRKPGLLETAFKTLVLNYISLFGTTFVLAFDRLFEFFDLVRIVVFHPHFAIAPLAYGAVSRKLTNSKGIFVAGFF
jgi:hypothetical protein